VPRCCTVTTGARLHFGPLAWRPMTGRDFGGWGVIVEAPRTVVEVWRGDQPDAGDFSPDFDGQQRAEAGLREYLHGVSQQEAVKPLSVRVRETLPTHRGLGAGTQLALAVARAAAELLREKVTTETLALRLHRGQRSAVGIYGFDQGGLIVDAGKTDRGPVGQLAARAEFPPGWRWMLVWPERSTGLAGDQELAAFQTLAPFPDQLSGRLARIVLTEILPAVESRDFGSFAAALDEYGEFVGRAFEPMQGGVVHAASRPIWSALRSLGVRGIAQTSWGPTLALACESATSAESLRSKLLAPGHDWPPITAIITPARNRGAEVVCLG